MITPEDKELFAAILDESLNRSFFDCEPGETSLQEGCQTYVDCEQSWINRRLAEFHVKQPKILFGFCQSWDFQAFAIEKPDVATAFIALSPFCLMHLHCFFTNALALRFVLTEVGNSAMEIDPVLLRSQEVTARRPLDQERKDTAKMLLMWAVRFLTAHEMTHILHGHLRLRHQRSSTVIAEARHTLSKGDALTSQTLEMDADCGAVLESLGDLILTPDAIADPRNSQLHPVYRQPLLMLRLWFFAIRSLFRLFEPDESIDLRLSSHPAPMLRAMWIPNVVYEALSKAGFDFSLETIGGIYSQSVVDSERTYAWMSDTNVDMSGSRTALSLNDHFATLLEEWGNLRPLLEPLNRAGRRLSPIQPQ